MFAISRARRDLVYQIFVSVVRLLRKYIHSARIGNKPSVLISSWGRSDDHQYTRRIWIKYLSWNCHRGPYEIRIFRAIRSSIRAKLKGSGRARPINRTHFVLNQRNRFCACHGGCGREGCSGNDNRDRGRRNRRNRRIRAERTYLQIDLRVGIERIIDRM